MKIIISEYIYIYYCTMEWNVQNAEIGLRDRGGKGCLTLLSSIMGMTEVCSMLRTLGVARPDMRYRTTPAKQGRNTRR